MRDDLRANRVRYFANLCDVPDIAKARGEPAITKEAPCHEVERMDVWW
jgi:hypothetical protein